MTKNIGKKKLVQKKAATQKPKINGYAESGYVVISEQTARLYVPKNSITKKRIISV